MGLFPYLIITRVPGPFLCHSKSLPVIGRGWIHIPQTSLHKPCSVNRFCTTTSSQQWPPGPPGFFPFKGWEKLPSDHNICHHKDPNEPIRISWNVIRIFFNVAHLVFAWFAWHLPIKKMWFHKTSPVNISIHKPSKKHGDYHPGHCILAGSPPKKITAWWAIFVRTPWQPCPTTPEFAEHFLDLKTAEARGGWGNVENLKGWCEPLLPRCDATSSSFGRENGHPGCNTVCSSRCAIRPVKFNSSPLKSYIPFQKERIVF